MRRKKFQLKLVPVVASALLTYGCGGNSSPVPKIRVCLDEQGRRVDDGQCEAPVMLGQPVVNPVSQPFRHWYFVSGGGAAPPVGAFVHGGPFGARSGFHGSGMGEHGISRGGFGSSAHASAGIGG